MVELPKITIDPIQMGLNLCKALVHSIESVIRSGFQPRQASVRLYPGQDYDKARNTDREQQFADSSSSRLLPLVTKLYHYSFVSWNTQSDTKQQRA